MQKFNSMAAVAAASCVVAAMASGAWAQTPISDPVPAIQKGPLSVGVQKYAQLPNSGGGGSPARLQGMVPAPDGSLANFAYDQRGYVYKVPAGGGTVGATPFLDLTDSSLGANFNALLGNEAGLAGFAFHPDYLKVGATGYGKFYTSYSAVRNTGTANYLGNDNGSHDAVIREWTMTDPNSATFSGASREVFRVGEFASNHNINTAAFNPNASPGDADYGNLYVGFGDGGGGSDPRGNGQNKATPLAGIIRINPLATTQAKYTVPADNPFVGQANTATELYATGLRNPQFFSWDKGGTGRMYAGDIGQNQIEEVDQIVKGANYGWQLREGTFATGTGVGGGDNNQVYPLPAGDASNGFTYPVAQYDHGDGNAVGGGFVYRGTNIPQLFGKYVFTDFARGRVFYLDEATLALGQQQTIQELRLTFGGQEQSLQDFLGGRTDARFAQDAAGELYIVTKLDGAVYALVPEPASLSLLGLGGLMLLRRRR